MPVTPPDRFGAAWKRVPVGPHRGSRPILGRRVVQDAYYHHAKEPEDQPGAMKDRFAGCLLGLAIGDALGMPFEGMPAHRIREQCGVVTDFVAGRYPAAGRYTDDTKMMLCLAESIVERGHVAPEDIAGRFVDWFDGGELRGIGHTCLESILKLKSGVEWRKSGRQGKWAAGNGTAMRIAPVGILEYHDLQRLRDDCWATSIITHNNSEAVAGATAVAYAIARLLTEELDPQRLLADVVAFIGDSEVADKLHLARTFLLHDVPTGKALATLGTSGYVVETVASALYCFFRTPRDFVSTVSSAVMGGGDTDTTAAIAGAISAAYNGAGNIPSHLAEAVEDGERLQDLGRTICRSTAVTKGVF